jgi:quinol---cytochrome c reductase iron-sulfur subunit, bacillus type
MAQDTNRRSFLSWVIFGLGGIFSVVLGFPVVAYVVDPRHRKGPKSAMKLVEGVNLDELVQNQPRQGVVRDTRTDGWTLYPNDVIGRVWVVQQGDRPDLSTPEKVAAFNSQPTTAKASYLLVFTTKCPHLGCFVNLNDAGNGFACPCHAATFNLDGKRAADGNPAQRGMDTLAWEIDAADPQLNRIKVTYQSYEANNADKVPIGGGEKETPNV